YLQRVSVAKLVHFDPAWHLSYTSVHLDNLARLGLFRVSEAGQQLRTYTDLGRAFLYCCGVDTSKTTDTD
ncbi:MAG: hypothetical protein V3T83_16435, partial [Acidobacteriota bacterium]